MPGPPRRTLVLGILGLALLAAAIAACSKGSTKPPPPVALELDSGNILSGSSYPHTFAKPGNFPYCCAIHGCSKMSGSVAVASGQPASAAVSITNFAFTPQNVSVAPGGTVTWTNSSGGTTHTVTSQ